MSSQLLVQVYFILVLLLSSLTIILSTNSSSTEQLPDFNDIADIIEDISVNVNNQFNATQLLEVKFINETYNHYHEQLNRLQTNLIEYAYQFARNLTENGKRWKQNAKNYSPSKEWTAKYNETLNDLFNELEISPICLLSFRKLKIALMNQELWPLKFIDSMDFYEPGFLDGYLSMFGDYEQCIHIDSRYYQPDSDRFDSVRGQYCMGKIRLPFINPLFDDLEWKNDTNELSWNTFIRLSYYYLGVDFHDQNNKMKLLTMANMFEENYFRIGLCLPSDCTSYELERAAKKFLKPIEGIIDFEIDKQCMSLDSKWKFDTYQLVAMLILGVLTLHVSVATIYEHYFIDKFSNYENDNNNNNNNNNNFEENYSNYDNTLNSYWRTFSAKSNTKFLLKNTQKLKKDNFNQYSIPSTTTTTMLDDEDVSQFPLIGSILTVLILFEIVFRSYALPIMYGLINTKRSGLGLQSQYFTSPLFIMMRCPRFSSGTFILLFSTTLGYNLCTSWSTKFGSNDDKNRKSTKYDLLRSNLHCYVRLMAPLIILLVSVVKHRSRVLIFTSLIILCSIITIGIKIYVPITVLPQEIEMAKSLDEIRNSFLHSMYGMDQMLVPFIIGLAIGYAILIDRKKIKNERKRCSFEEQKLLNLGLWSCAVILPMIAVQWSEQFSSIDGNFSNLNFLSWISIGMLMWCIGIGWILFAVATGRDIGPIGELITIDILRPLNRLSFGAYMNHFVVQSFRFFNKKQMTVITHIETLTEAISDIVICYMLSYIFFIIIEQPFYHWIQLVVPIKMETKECEIEKDLSKCKPDIELNSNGDRNQNGFDTDPLNY
ncbi:hypothetical protein RDWZM_000471 [Blomia tropicalis]|uniref:Nose resistant-to-fluoxetine protein N-terminal domain-containing protein n=1 Tax=Blomia tropicalis TaxID=40697 RepID=A0A9Q0M9N2_BLOTA|nr:hypothetical protein RDWZM_000471 [Blomia tropicalis]